MIPGGAFGTKMAGHFHLADVPSFVTEAVPESPIAITRLVSRTAPGHQTTIIPQERAFVFEWQLGPHSGHELRSRGSTRPTSYARQGTLNVVNLECDPVADLDTPFDCVHFYLSRKAIDAFAHQQNASRVQTMKCPRGTVDETVNCMGNMLLNALGTGASGCKILRESLLVALAWHLSRAYGGVALSHDSVRGRLAPWQVRRATELLMANIDGDISLAELAAECQLSASHFARAFKGSTGKSPHRWLIEQRVGRSKVLLSKRELALADIALECGFSEQATFSRTFKREVGTSPGAWRRLYQA